MKRIIFLLLAFMPLIASAQIITIGKDAKARKAFNKERETRIDEGWDIVPFPGEYPQHVQSFRAEGVTNWGSTLLLPESIKQRMAAECTFPVKIKIFDTGGGSSHPYLQRGQTPGTNYTTSTTLEDVHGHSTHVTGIIAANEFGLTNALVQKGLVTFEMVKILSDNGSGDFSWVTNAIVGEDVDNKQLLDKGTFVVVNGSFGGGTAKIAAMEAALKTSSAMGVLYCFAAGNTSGAGVNYPGNSEFAIACAAIGEDQKRASFSTTGPEVWAAMPGVGINSTFKGGGFATMSGTSMATPFLTGATAIAKSKWGNAIPTLAAMKNYLAWCATDIDVAGKDNNTGWGVEFVRAILDKNPKDAPPMNPGDPGNPGNPGDPVKREQRVLTFVVPGPFEMFWTTSQTAGVEPEIIKVTRTGKNANVAAMNKITIPELEFAVISSTDVSTERKRLIDNCAWYFKNRGLMLAAGNDFADATYWSAYFFEMLLETQRSPKQSGDVFRITAKNEKGESVVYNWGQLKRWPIQQTASTPGKPKQ